MSNTEESADNTFVEYGQECGRSRLRRFKPLRYPKGSAGSKPVSHVFLVVQTKCATIMCAHAWLDMKDEKWYLGWRVSRKQLVE